MFGRLCLMSVILFFMSTTGCLSVTNADIPIDDCAHLENEIENAKEGATILLPARECTISSTIAVPDGITVAGRPGTKLIAAYPDSQGNRTLFDLTGTHRATFRDFAIDLTKQARGFRGKDGSGLRLERLTLRGDLLGEDTTSHAVYLTHFNDVHVESNTITENFGGIYIVGDSGNIVIANNHLERVNFGNIVVSGEKIRITDNVILDPGYPSQNHHASGDGITLGADTTDALIAYNVFRNGRCYLINAPRGIRRNLRVHGNLFMYGATSAINLTGGDGVAISGNLFVCNRAHAVLACDVTNAEIVNNIMVDDTLYLRRVQGVSEPNTFISSETCRGAVDPYYLPGGAARNYLPLVGAADGALLELLDAERYESMFMADEEQ